MFSKPLIVNQVRCILINFCVFLLSHTLISCAKSDDNKTSSTSSFSETSEHLSGVTYGNGIFVTVGDKGTILTSSNGTTWTERTSGTSEQLYAVTYGDGLFVTVGENATILTSSDGTTWTERDGLRSKWAIPKYLKGVTYRKKLFVAVGRNGLILNSPDGTTWKERKSGTGYNLVGITYANGIFVSVGRSGKIVTSFDGNWWVKRTYVLPTRLNGVTFGNDTFMTVGDNGIILTSSDGISWTKITSVTTNSLGTVKFLPSLTDISCSKSSSGSKSSTGKFIMVGNSGTIFTSADGTSWDNRTSGTTNNLSGVTYGNNTFVTVGDNGTILTSSDGTTWTNKKSLRDDSSRSSSGDGMPGTYQLATNDYANGVATDSSGNVYVAGGTIGGLDGNTSSGNTDLFVVKYNASGTKQWTKQLGSSGRDSANGVATDSSGNVYVTGVTFGGLDCNTSAGANDLFVVKYNASGTKQWTKQLGSASSDFANGVATDSSENVYVAGATYGGLDNNTSAGNSDLFVVKYNSSGTKQWTKQLGTAEYDEARGVAIDLSGNVYVVGGTKGNLKGNSNSGRTDLFVVKYNSSGTRQWTKLLGTSDTDLANGVATDSSGNVYVAGVTYKHLDGNTSAGKADLFVVKYNSSGTKQWTKQLGTSSRDHARGVATDSSGNVYVTGDTYGGIDSNTNAGYNDLFVVKYNSSGTKQWTKQLGTSSTDLANGVATDSSGDVYVTGGTYGGLDGNTNAGNSDLFVVKYNSNGTKQWTKQMGSSSRDHDYGVATDSSGKVFVSGDTFGKLD